MKTSDFDYKLPEKYIAQTPIEPRDASSLLVLDRSTGKIEHTIFREIGKYLKPNDLLVINETRVIPARLFGHKLTGGKVEVLLLKQLDSLLWEVIVGGKGMVAGKEIVIDNGPNCKIVEVLDGPKRLVLFDSPLTTNLLQEIGHVPLPPYIHLQLSDPERYQTIYAKSPGSSAAPTAGLHFTSQLIENLQKNGIRFVNVTLHIGLDTFMPVNEESPLEHKIHTEWCKISKQAAFLINQTHESGGRVIAVGTTSVRTLESGALRATAGQAVAQFEGATDLFILPGYKFRVVDGLITNFHLPKSTLIMLVSAFAGREKILQTYEIAKERGYRFYSFGDAMLIL